MIQEALFLSYDFDLTSFAQGPPSNSDGSIKDVTINSDGTCGNGWICEHRWRQIHSMVEFRYISSNCLLKFFCKALFCINGQIRQKVYAKVPGH